MPIIEYEGRHGLDSNGGRLSKSIDRLITSMLVLHDETYITEPARHGLDSNFMFQPQPSEAA